MYKIQIFYRNTKPNVDEIYLQNSHLLANTKCSEVYSSRLDAFIEKCPNRKCITYINKWDNERGELLTECEPFSAVGEQIIGVILVLVITIPSIIFFRVFTKKKGNTKEIKTKIKENYLNKTSGTNKLDNSNDFDSMSFIEELKEEKYPDASILESYVKGSYVILKDLNGKTIAEIKIPE